MTTDHDEFWGDEAGWSTSPQREHTAEQSVINDPTPQRGISGKASRLWGSLLSSGSKASRAHGAESAAPVDHDLKSGPKQQIDDNSNEVTEEWDEGWDVEPTPVPTGGVDPLLAKFGGAAVVLTLLIPVVLGFRSGSDQQLIEAASAVASAAATPSDELDLADAPETSIAAAEITAGEQVSTSSASEQVATSSASSETSTPAAEAESVERATLTSDSRSTSELSGSIESAEADSSSEQIAAAAEADEPAVRVEPVCPIEYEVVVGDFWIRIADGAGVPVSDLLELNGAGSGTPLHPGSSICLPAGASAPPPPSPPVTAAPATSPATTAAPTTVTPTTAAPTTAAPAPPPPAAPADIEQIIRDVWPDELEERALEIAWRESNYVPTAKNYCCYGIFQMYWEVHKSWLNDMGITSADQLYDPVTNTRAAYALYERAGGWGPWGF